MVMKTFDELDAASGINGLLAEPARPRADAASLLAPSPSVGDTFAAAFRADNTIGAVVSRKDAGLDNHDDGTFDPVAFVKEHGLHGYESSFVDIMNERRAHAVKNQIVRELEDRKTLEAAGWTGTLARIAAGVFDAPTLIPGTVAVRGAKGAWSVGRSALLGGVSTGAAQAVTEAALQSSQETRTAGESLVNIGSAAVLGSLVGGGIAAALGRGERKAMEKALGEIAALNLDGNVHVGGAGADIAEGAHFVDPVTRQRGRDDLAVAGGAADAVVRATSWFNPVLRGTQRYAASARQTVAGVFEGTIYRKMHDAGDTLGASAETMARAQVSAQQALAGAAAESAFSDMRKAGVRMSSQDFYDEVGRAMRSSDEHANPHVAQAAQAYRKAVDHFTEQMLGVARKLRDAGEADHPFLRMLDDGALDPKTAASYFTRVYNRDRLLATEPEFLDVVGREIASRMASEYEKDVEKLAAARARHKEQIGDLSLAGAELAARIEDLKRAGDKLDAQNAHFADLDTRLSEARAAVKTSRGADREAARSEVKTILAQGGKDFEDFLSARAGLRRRMSNMRTNNPDNQLARGEQISERIAAVQEAAGNSLAAFAKRAKNLLNSISGKPVTEAMDAVRVLRDSLDAARARLAAAEARASRLYAQYTEHMSPEAAFHEGAAQATKNVGENVALRAGTREADRVSGQVRAAQQAVKNYEAALSRLDAVTARLEQGETKLADAPAAIREIEQMLDDAAKSTADVNLRRGEFIQRQKERAAALTPEEVAKRAAAKNAQLTRVLDAAEERFFSRWQKRLAAGAEITEKYDFEGAARIAAAEAYRSVSGLGHVQEDMPKFVVKITTGPMRERTLMIPDEILDKHGWLINDAREVVNRYSRAMAGEIELTRRFGRADMREQLAQVTDEYTKLKLDVDAASSVAEVNRVLGRDKYAEKLDLAKVKRDAVAVLSADQASALVDIKAGRDLIRGSYLQGANNTNYASVTRSLAAFNYLRHMGGVLLSNISDFYRPAMVHGLRPYLDTLPDIARRAFRFAGAETSEGFDKLMKESKLAGVVTERINHHMLVANGDIADPFVSNTSHVERLLQKGTKLASRWNAINLFTDAQQAIASVLVQNRILSAVVDGSDERLLAMLGIGGRTKTDIAELFARHGEIVDGVRVANTEKWLAEARADGSSAAIARAERAVLAYRSAVNMDVNSVVSRRGLGAAPLFAHTPTGRLLTQFSGFMMGAHSNVTIRGLQEDQARFVGGLVATTMLGALTSYFAAARGGRERFEKYVRDTAANPALLIGEGLDRSGVFPMLFDFSNRFERASGAVGYQYRVNPVKSSLALLGGGRGAVGITSTRASDSAGIFGALGGPTAGLIDSAVSTGRVIADVGSGRPPPKHDINSAMAFMPFQSYYGMREILQILSGNSVYVRH